MTSSAQQSTETEQQPVSHRHEYALVSVPSLGALPYQLGG